MPTKTLGEQLKKVVSICNRFISARPTLPVLANIYIKSEKTKLVLSATNLEASIIIEIPASGEDWEITIPGKILGEFLNSTQSQETNLEVLKESLKINSGNVSASIAGIAASEFPKLPEIKAAEKVSFKEKELQEAVNKVSFAASIDESKPVLNSILITVEEGKTNLVATDGYRLAKKTLAKNYELKQILVPARIFPEALRVAAEMEEEEISLSTSENENQLIIYGDSFQVSTRLVDGVYPSFNQRIPSTFVTEVIVDKASLIDAIKATAVLARDTGNVVKLNFDKNNYIEIDANTAQLGESSAKVEAKITGEGLKIAFNSRYLLEGLSNAKENTLKLAFSGALSPAAVTGENEENFVYIVMPVKAQN